jgi:hypothetical protein
MPIALIFIIFKEDIFSVQLVDLFKEKDFSHYQHQYILDPESLMFRAFKKNHNFLLHFKVHDIIQYLQHNSSF